ncbi:MAG: hypothetical protein WD696_07700 [Bryobacteraceae bacterium]
MRWSRRSFLAYSLPGSLLPLGGQAIEEFFDVYTEHPRLFLRPQRLRLLRRERERRSLRWQPFETLLAGRARMPEAPFAQALYYQVAGDKDIGREAVRSALQPAFNDLRQLALIFDWTQEILQAAEVKTFASKLQRGIEAARAKPSIPAMRSRVLAAVSLAEHAPDLVRRELETAVNEWWRKTIAPALKGGRNVAPRDETYPLFELLHAIRDNLQIDLRDPVPGFFKGLPIFHLLSYYPATFPAPENEYRIPVSPVVGEPDLRRATLSRAAELAMVAYDTNAPESQVLQGWLMHDNFLMRGVYGIPYEFLWANPYQPGLSYYHVPLVFHDDLFGRLLARSTWDDNATWVGYADNQLQIFRDGAPEIVDLKLRKVPIELPEAVIYAAESARQFKIRLDKEQDLFIVGLKPRRRYEVEVDDEEMREELTDLGGILPLTLAKEVEVGVRMREAAAASYKRSSIKPP